MQNIQIAKIFNELADLLEIEGENPFKVRAYRYAARTISSLGRELEDMIKEGKDLTLLPSIGKEIAAKIEQIIKTGKLEKLEKLKKKIPPSLIALLPIEGLGPKKIKRLYDALQIQTVQELIDAAKSHKISQLKGFGPKTEQKILEGLTLIKQSGKRFLYSDAKPYADELKDYLQKAFGVEDLEIAGSFRRSKESVGDLDIVCSSSEPAKVIEHFCHFDKVKRVVLSGDTRATIILENNLQVDLRVVQKESYGSALHYFTGSKDHVIKIRQIAQDKGLKVNEYGIFKGDEKLAGENEEWIYRLFDLAWITPELRENRGEIEAAKNNTLPKLITKDDIKGDLHLHSDYGNGTSSIEDLAKRAIELGYEYIAIADHSYMIAIDKKRAFEQFDMIDHLNSEFENLHIFKSMDIDILEDGSIGVDREILQRLDFGIASIRDHFDLSKDEQTNRVIKALKNRYIKIISHPTCRIINEYPPCEIDLDEVFRVAKEEGKYLEISSNPSRLDLDDIHIKRGIESGVKIVISSDASDTNSMDNIEYGVNQARRGWAEQKDVVNSLSLDEARSVI